MCDCLAWHPAWKLAGKRAGAPPGMVFAVFMALRHGGPYPLDARTLAVGLGWKPIKVALVLSALQVGGVIGEDLRPIGEWADRDDRDSYRDIVTDRDVTVTVTAEEHRRTVDRARQRRWRDQKKANAAARLAALNDAATPAPIVPLTESVTSRVTGPLEEERIFSLSSQGARDPTIAKREQLMNKAHEEARRRLTPAQYAALIKQTTEPAGRYERYLQHGTSAFPKPTREFYEAIFKQMRQRREEGARELRTEPQFPLPMTFKRTG